jgi:hypothetical protein
MQKRKLKISKYFKDDWIINIRNPERKYKAYVHSARIRGKLFTLSLEQATELFQKPCYYCGDIQRNGLNGIDRRDNNIGYLLKNCVPACKWCNRMKGVMQEDHFIEQCIFISKIHTSQKPAIVEYIELSDLE